MFLAQMTRFPRLSTSSRNTSSRCRPLNLEHLEARLALTGTPLVQVKLQATDLLGNPITSIVNGSDFLLQGTVKDLRPSPQGVFGAWVDVSYDSARASVDGLIVPGPLYPNVPSGDASTPGFIDEVGSFDGITPLGAGEKLLFTVPFTANALGTLTFVLDPADDTPQHDTLLFGSGSAVSPTDIVFVNGNLEVVPPPRMQYKLATTDLLGNPITSITKGSDFLL